MAYRDTKEVVIPTAPPAGQIRVFARGDNKMYMQDGDTSEIIELTSGATPLLYQKGDLVNIDVPAGENVVVLAADELPSVLKAAVGAVETIGTVVAAHSGVFGVHSLDVVAGLNVISPQNLALVFDVATLQPIISDNGSVVMALLQSESAIDAHTISATVPNRVQLSFVRLSAGGDAIEAAPVADIGDHTIKYAFTQRSRMDDLPQEAFLSGMLAPGGGGGGGGAGWIYIEDLTVAGGETISDKVWLDPPANTVLEGATSSTQNINVVVRASYPLVQVNEVDGTLARVSGAYFAGQVAITLPASGPIEAVVMTPDGEEGAKDTCTVALDLPPAVTDAHFAGSYPIGFVGPQWELKENDAFGIEVTADKLFDLVEVTAYGASKLVQSVVAPAALTHTMQIQAADQGNTPQQFPARVRVRDAVTGAWSATRDTNFGGGAVDGVDVVTLNDLRPSGSVTGVAYPPGQAALKGTEATPAPGVQNTAANYDTIIYSDPTGAQLTIPNIFVFEANKLVTCRNPGLFNNSTTNFRMTLQREANGSQTIVNGVVVIADVAPSVTIAKPATRLRSGGNNSTAAQNHTITIQSNQPLLNAPTLNADSGGNRGTFLGSWAAGPSNWTRSLQVSELVPDEKGTFAFAGLVATGLAGLVQNAPAGGSEAYVLGGFVSRDLTFPAFNPDTALGVQVVDFSKLTASTFTATNQPALKQAIGTTPPVTDGYTIDALNPATTKLIWLDTSQVNANASGTAQILAVQETI